VFDGAPLAERTTVTRDESGQVTGWVTERDSQWTERDRSEALALEMYESWKCPCGCGLMSRDTLSHEDDGVSFKARKIRCRARNEIVREQNESNADNKEAVLWWAEREG
jgi:hypothetical protein